jgi:hypothetical protein
LDEEDATRIRKMSQKIEQSHPSEINPSEVEECLFVDYLQKLTSLQVHTCGDRCLIKRFSNKELRKKGFNPDNFNLHELNDDQVCELMRCQKNFPKTVPKGEGVLRAHVNIDFNGIVHYNPPRDNAYVNNYHPIFQYLWGANTDMQVLMQKCMLSLCLYRTLL